MTKVAVAVEGWNAEAAVGFALAARKFASSVTLRSSRETVDGKDEIEVMTLGPEPGEEVLMAVDGRDEKDAFDALLARLLGVIEPRKDGIAAVNGPVTAGRKKTATPRRRRVAEIAALDVEEVAPVMRSYGKRMRTGQFRAARSGRVHERVDNRLGRDAKPPPRQKGKLTPRKSKGSSHQKATSARRKPRRRKK